MNKTAFALVLATLVSPVFAGPTEIKEGLWEISSKVTMSQIAVDMPAMTQTQCVSQSSVDPQQLLKAHNCQFSRNQNTGNTVSWTMSCMEQGIKMNGSGSMTYQETAFNGHFDLEMNGEAGPVTMSTQIDGRYLGACNR